MNKEAETFSKTSATVYELKLRHITQIVALHQCRCDNLQSYIISCTYCLGGNCGSLNFYWRSWELCKWINVECHLVKKENFSLFNLFKYRLVGLYL
jgi:hypothetical protein